MMKKSVFFGGMIVFAVLFFISDCYSWKVYIAPHLVDQLDTIKLWDTGVAFFLGSLVRDVLVATGTMFVVNGIFWILGKFLNLVMSPKGEKARC